MEAWWHGCMRKGVVWRCGMEAWHRGVAWMHEERRGVAWRCGMEAWRGKNSP